MTKSILFLVLLVPFQTSSEAFVCQSQRSSLALDGVRTTPPQRQSRPFSTRLSLVNERNPSNIHDETAMGRQGSFPRCGPSASRHSTTTSLSAMSAPTSPTEDAPTEEEPTKDSKAIKVWVHLLSVFVVISYLQPLNLPENLATIQTVLLDPLLQVVSNFIGLLPFQVWSLIHAVSGMVFGGSILCTTFVEWMWPDELEKMLRDNNSSEDATKSETTTQTLDDLSLQLLINKMATQTLFPMEGKLVLPGVTGSMISGIAQSFYNYGSLRLAPRHVKSSLHLIFLFGLWWAFTDRKSQEDLVKLSSIDIGDRESATQEEIVDIWKRRRLFNSISCLFVVALYGTMVLKPGF